MKNFEKISKMNLADLDRPEGILEEESIQDEDLLVEKTAQNPEDEERSETIVTENIQEQPEELAKKEMMEPQGRHFRVDANVTEKELKAFLFGHTYRQPLMIIVTILAIAWPLAVLIQEAGKYYDAVDLFFIYSYMDSIYNKSSCKECEKAESNL